MRKLEVLCDFCGEPLRTEKRKDIFGVEHNVVIRGTLKHIYEGVELDLLNYDKDCCETCATKIDLNATTFKLKILQEGKI